MDTEKVSGESQKVVDVPLNKWYPIREVKSGWIKG